MELHQGSRTLHICTLSAYRNVIRKIYSFSSDCFKNGSVSLFEHLALVLRCCVIYSHVSQILLLSTFISLVKNKLSSGRKSLTMRGALIFLIVRLFPPHKCIPLGETFSTRGTNPSCGVCPRTRPRLVVTLFYRAISV